MQLPKNQLLKNRHVKVALLAAPVLSILSFVAVDRLVSEKPAAAVRGRSYPLAPQSNCRHAGGSCTLENGDVKVRVRARRLNPDEVELSVSSELPISNALVSVGSEESFSRPAPLAGRSKLTARLQLSEPEREHLRWAVTIRGAIYFSETPAVFVDRESFFPRENFAVQNERE